MARVGTFLILFWSWLVFFLSYGFCPEKCECYDFSSLVSCKNLNEFPKPPLKAPFYYLSIFESTLNGFENLEFWTELQIVSLHKSQYDCYLLLKLKQKNIKYEIDSEMCESTTTDSSLSLPSSFIPFTMDESTPFSLFSESYTKVENFSLNPTNFPTTQDLSTPISLSTIFSTPATFAPSNNKESGKKIKIIIVVLSTVIGFGMILIMVFICFWKKKVNISRFPPNVPSRSDLELGNSLDTIEMESFESFDFQSSYENIYEIPNPSYLNV
jgi:hypothetical protein